MTGANGLPVEQGGVIEHWINCTWFMDGQASYTLVFTQPVEEHPVAGYSKDGKQVKSGKDKEVVNRQPPCPAGKRC